MTALAQQHASAEAFVRRFHARRPGVTRRAFARGRAVGDGRSSYEILAAAVPAAARVLDLGCGDGVIAPGAIGIDLSAAELAIARGACVIQARAEALPFARGAFDACVSHLAFSILPDPAAAAHEVARVLAPGGTFAIVTGGGPVDGAADAFERFLALARPDVARHPPAPRLGDRRARSREGLDLLLGPAGFGAVTFASYTIDLGGGFDDVWTTLATIYELDALSAEDLTTSREKLADDCLPDTHLRCADTHLRCVMRVGVASAIRGGVG